MVESSKRCCNSLLINCVWLLKIPTKKNSATDHFVISSSKTALQKKKKIKEERMEIIDNGNVLDNFFSSFSIIKEWKKNGPLKKYD